MTSISHSEYQKDYRKFRVHRIIIFSQEEYNFLFRMAEKYKKPFSTFIRELALAQATNEYLLPNDDQTKTVQVLLTRIGTNINQIAHVSNATMQIPDNAILEIKNHFSKLEKDIMNVYHQPIMIEDMVRYAISKQPEYRNRIQKILNGNT